MRVLVDAGRRRRLWTLRGAFLFVIVSASGVFANALPDAPVLISEPGSTRALTLPAGVVTPGADTQVTLFVTNLVDLLPGEGRTAFRADVVDSRHFRYPLEIVSFERTATHKRVFAITVRLHGGIGDVGDTLIRVTWRGMSSNRVRLAIGHMGGRIEDDEGSVPTPMPGTQVTTASPDSVGLPWSGDRVRFMQQATFGVTAAVESRLRRISYSTWIAEQMEEKRDASGDLRYSTYPYPRFPLSVTIPPLTCDGISLGGNPVDTDPLCFRNRYTMWPIQNWFFREALYGEDQQLRRRVSWALSQILVVGGRETIQSGRMIPYLETLDKHAFGNFRNLLRDITLNPAMGNYLDMAISTRQAPNENYPREILQLFSIGVDMLNVDGTPILNATGGRIPTYDQNTVNEFTKVFTGWTMCNGAACPNSQPGIVNFIDPMIANAANHDTSQKTLLGGTILPAGQTPEQDLTQTLDNIFYHQNVGPFISKLLIQQLVTSNPTPAYVGRVAAVFNSNSSGIRGDMKSVIRAILLDPEARGNLKTDPDYGHLREPVLFLTSFLRPNNPQANTNLAPLAECNGQSDGMLNLAGTLPLDQDVFMPPTVFNYYPMDYYIPATNLAGPEFGIFSTGTALKRPNLVNLFVLPGGNPGTPGVLANRTIVQGIPNLAYAPCGTRIDLTRLEALATSDLTAEQLVALLNREMLHGSMSERMRGDIVTAVQAVAPSAALKRARTAFYLVATSPQFQVQR